MSPCPASHRHPQPCPQLLLSIEEYERLNRRDQRAFLAADTPEQFLPAIEELANRKE